MFQETSTMQNNIGLIFIFTISLYDFMQAEDPKNKQSKKIIEQKVTKKEVSQKFIKIETYADLQTSPLNRPSLETKKELFTPAEYKKQNHYHAPNMNEWASENPSKRTCEIGDLNIMGTSFTITSSSPSSKDPFKKPLPGPR